jgi:hypothetical protein
LLGLQEEQPGDHGEAGDRYRIVLDPDPEIGRERSKAAQEMALVRILEVEMGNAGRQGAPVSGAVAAGGGGSQPPKRRGGLTDVGRQFLRGKRGAGYANGGMRQPPGS